MGSCHASESTYCCSSGEDYSGNGTRLVRVGYRSTVKPGVDMEAIIAKAKEFNRTIKVGGALWYDPKTHKCHQILEGEERAVTKLLDKIMMDRRHKAIIMEHMVPISHRKFDDWGGMKLNNAPLLNKAPKKNAMGFRMHDEWESEEEHVEEVKMEPKQEEATPEEAPEEAPAGNPPGAEEVQKEEEKSLKAED
mmetsp:Transcript_1216/g.2290  ORF Transcript_1216/g.2290 Transcript_1216/m.2290 type:complete len:193 (+) Transcript_1216:79-657(+)